VKFAIEHASLFEHYHRTPVVSSNGGAVEVHCDLAVATLAMDTMEAASTYGGLSRFGWRPAAKNGGTDAGCLLCSTPTCKYDSPSSVLSTRERSLRTVTTVQAARDRGNKEELHRNGVYRDSARSFRTCH